QLYENYQRKSSHSVSIVLFYIWLAGDLLNLAGTILQELLPTVIYLAIYYVLSDIVIILQILYYRRPRRNTFYTGLIYDSPIDSESAPLLPERSNSQIPTNNSKIGRSLKILFGIIGVFLTGVIIYYFSSLSRCANPLDVKGGFNILIKDDSNMPLHMKLLPQILGWCSAVFYLSSRIPQIIKNHKSKSTEGLSLGMFCFSSLGNTAFCSSILLYSMDYEYLLINLPWLLGSGGTLFFDLI
ncbi:1599_t:CDS:2, partial [Racocetra persica]